MKRGTAFFDYSLCGASVGEFLSKYQCIGTFYFPGQVRQKNEKAGVEYNFLIILNETFNTNIITLKHLEI